MQLSGNKVKHGKDSNICLNQHYDGKKNIVLRLRRSDPEQVEPTEAADAVIRSSSLNLNTVEASDIKNNNNNSPEIAKRERSGSFHTFKPLRRLPL